MHVLLVPEALTSLLIPQAGCSLCHLAFPHSQYVLAVWSHLTPIPLISFWLIPRALLGTTQLLESPLLKSCVLFLGRSWYPTQSSPTLSR